MSVARDVHECDRRVDVLLDTPDVKVAAVRCRAPRSGWSGVELTGGTCFVMPRAGRFLRAVDGVEHLVDRTVSYFEAPGREQRIAHPSDGGDTCVAIAFTGTCAASFPDPGDLPARPLPSTPRMHLASLLLLRSHRLRDRAAAEGAAIDLVATALGSEAALPATALRPDTVARRTRIVSEARLLLQHDVTLSVPALARLVGTSPHHLSRIFHAVTGCTIGEYRDNVRVGMVVDRLAEGEDDLAALAADAGFYDHAHMCKTVLRTTRSTPSAIRAVLTATGG